MARTQNMGERDAAGATPSAPSRDENTALLPRSVRRWMLAGMATLLLAALYLISVRGTAILFDLRDAVSALCF